MKLTFSLAALSSVSIVVLFAQLLYVMTTLGPGLQTDALFAASALPQVILAVVSGSLTYVLVPLLSSEDSEQISQEAWNFVAAVGALFSTGAILLAGSASVWVPLLFPGFSAEAKAVSIRLARIQMLGMVLTAIVTVLWSVLHARRQFLWAEFSSLVANLAGLTFLIWGLRRFGVEAAAWVLVVSAAFQIAFLCPTLGRPRMPRWRSRAMSEALRRIRPLLLGALYFKTDLLVDRFLASMAPAGGLSLLYVGQQIYSAANQVLNKAVVAPVVPSLALEAKRKHWERFANLVRRRVSFIVVVCLIGYLSFLLVGEWMLQLLIGHGGVTKDNVNLLWTIMTALGGVFVGGAVGQMTSASFYAEADTRTPTVLGVWTYSIFVPIKCLAFFAFGLVGLAISTSVFVVLNSGLQFLILRHRSKMRMAAQSAS